MRQSSILTKPRFTKVFQLLNWSICFVFLSIYMCVFFRYSQNVFKTMKIRRRLRETLTVETIWLSFSDVNERMNEWPRNRNLNSKMRWSEPQLGEELINNLWIFSSGSFDAVYLSRSALFLPGLRPSLFLSPSPDLKRLYMYQFVDGVHGVCNITFHLRFQSVCEWIPWREGGGFYHHHQQLQQKQLA